MGYARKITKNKTFLEDRCPCECLSELLKYVLNEKEQLDIE